MEYNTILEGRDVKVIMFSSDSIKELLEGFSLHLQKTGLKSDTSAQYKAIIDNFLRSYVVNKVADASYADMFTEENITGFIQERKSNIVQAALNNFVKHLISRNLIFKYYEIPKGWFEKAENVRKDEKIIAPRDVLYILSDECRYRNEDEKLRAQLLCALCFYCFFEQKHVRNMKLADIEDQYIRNLRYTDETPYLVQRILINSPTTEILSKYIDHFFPQKIERDIESFLFYVEGHIQSDVNLLNDMLQPLSRRENKEYLSSDIDCQSLCFNGILLWLRATQGRSLPQLMQIIEYKNKQLSKAYQYYFQNFSIDTQINGYISTPAGSIIQNADKEEPSYIEDDLLAEPGEVIQESEQENESFPYNEGSDITEDDIMNYDSFNPNNQITHSVTIERMVRLTELSKRLKKLYSNRCQLCGIQLRNRSGEYFSEAHHLRPYNRIHQGDDAFANMIILCPNCHSQFDQLYYAIEPDTLLVHCVFPDDRFHMSSLNMIATHILDKESLAYTWSRFQVNSIDSGV